MEQYDPYLDIEENKILIGIDRIWEEYAWSIMHQFDKNYQPTSSPDSDKALRELKTAKRYLLAGLSLLLGFDCINENISANEIKCRTTLFLNEKKWMNEKSKHSFKKRISDFCTSIGHWHNLYETLVNSHSIALDKELRLWYQYGKKLRAEIDS